MGESEIKVVISTCFCFSRKNCDGLHGFLHRNQGYIGKALNMHPKVFLDLVKLVRGI